MKPACLPIVFFLALLYVLTGCAPDFQADPLVREIRLDKNIHNLLYSNKQIYYQVKDSVGWAEVWSARDTVVREGPHLKFRSEKIWYEVTDSPTGYRARQHYPGWERRIDSIDRSVNLLRLLNNHRVKVDIPAADVVLGGDSVRIAVVHTTGPAFDWDFREYTPQPDQLLLTTPGNDTMVIVQDMGCIGPVSRQTVFRVGKQTYVLRSIGEDYRSVVIERLADGRGVALTAELDLTYKQMPVKDLSGAPTTVKRRAGKGLIIYFYGGFYGEEQLLRLDSIYQAAPPERREAFDLVAVSRNSTGNYMETMKKEKNIALPLYQGTAKTCLRLNCVGFVPYAIFVDKRGKITSFHEWTTAVEALLTGEAEKAI